MLCVFDLACWQVADPKTIGHVTPSQIHHMKELADEYVAIETRITTEYEASLRTTPIKANPETL